MHDAPKTRVIDLTYLEIIVNYCHATETLNPKNNTMRPAPVR